MLLEEASTSPVARPRSKGLPKSTTGLARGHTRAWNGDPLARKVQRGGRAECLRICPESCYCYGGRGIGVIAGNLQNPHLQEDIEGAALQREGIIGEEQPRERRGLRRGRGPHRGEQHQGILVSFSQRLRFSSTSEAQSMVPAVAVAAECPESLREPLA